MPVELEIKGDDYGTPVEVFPGISFSKSQLLGALFAKYPQRRAFLKNYTYKIKIPSNPDDPNSPKKEIKLRLHNDIIYRPSAGSQKVKPEVIFRSVMENGKRVIKPHIIYRPYPSKTDEPRFSVLDPQIDIRALGSGPIKGALGKGSFGAVFPVLGTLAPKLNNWVFKTNKERALKVQKIGKSSREEIDKEHNLLVQAGHMSAKEIVEDDGKTFILQERGQTSLYSFLNEEKQQTEPQLTVDQRYQLTINILRALKEQIQDRGIVSRDIKPHNILINLATLEVKIIDLGLGKNIIDKEDTTRCGTPAWMAPDVFKKEAVDERSDWFSIGLVISELWGKPFDARGNNEIFKTRPFDLTTDLSTLFDDLETKGFVTPPEKMPNENEKREIEKIAKGLVDPNKETRMNLDDAILKMEKERQLHLTEAQKRAVRPEEIERALALGQALRDKLKTLSHPKEYIIENFEQAIKSAEEFHGADEEQQKCLTEAKKAHEKLIAIIKKFEKKIVNGNGISNSLSKELQVAIDNASKQHDKLRSTFKLAKPNSDTMFNEIKQAVEDLKDDPIEAFIAASGIACLKNIDSPAAIISKLERIQEETNENLKNILALRDKLESYEPFSLEKEKEKTKILSELDDVLNKYGREGITVDKFVSLNRNFAEKIVNLEESVNAVTNSPHSDLVKRKNELVELQHRIETSLDQFAQVKNQDIKTIVKKLKSLNEQLNSKLEDYKKLRKNGAPSQAWIDTFQDESRSLIEQANTQIQKLSQVKVLKQVTDLKDRIESVRNEINGAEKIDSKNKRLAVLKVIENYVEETFTVGNLNEADRVVSAERQKDIKDLLDIIECKDQSTFDSKIENALHGMKSGIEKAFLVGSLFRILNEKAKNFKYTSLGGLFFKSELRTRIKEVVEKEQVVVPSKKSVIP